MKKESFESPMRIRLSAERRAKMLAAIKGYYSSRFDEILSDFRAEELLDFFVAQLGPAVYNQGVQDARAFLQNKLDDIEGEVYEPERPITR
jgi:uncharacterized protein (DUF2164 family)